MLAILLSGCVRPVPVPDLPPGYRIRPLGTVAPETPLAWHPDGMRYAIVDGGIVIGTVAGERHRLYPEPPSALAWSPTGAYLAATFATPVRSTVRIFGEDGAELAENEIAGSVLDLAWVSDDELLMAAVSVRSFSFGGNYAVKLLHWKQNSEVTSRVIVDTSPFRSVIDAMGEKIFDTVHLQMSPYRDEILYTRLLTPPNAPIRYSLVVRHLESGREKEIADLPFGSEGGLYLGDGERVFFSDGQYQSIIRSIWGTAAYETLSPGRILAISPGGRYRMIDDTVYVDRDVLLFLPDNDRAAFSPDGSRLLIASGHRLFLVSGFSDAEVGRIDLSSRLLELRRWRSEGLITPSEFLQYSRELMR